MGEGSPPPYIYSVTLMSKFRIPEELRGPSHLVGPSRRDVISNSMDRAMSKTFSGKNGQMSFAGISLSSRRKSSATWVKTGPSTYKYVRAPA